jgi:hypothetical protein
LLYAYQQKSDKKEKEDLAEKEGMPEFIEKKIKIKSA